MTINPNDLRAGDEVTLRVRVSSDRGRGVVKLATVLGEFLLFVDDGAQLVDHKPAPLAVGDMVTRNDLGPDRWRIMAIDAEAECVWLRTCAGLVFDTAPLEGIRRS